MRFLLTPLLVAATTTALSAEPAQYELDPEHTAVYFTVDHIGYSKTLGIFGEVSGTFTYDMETQDLLGETKPVTLNVTLNKADTYPFGHGRFVLGLSIDTSIKRSEFGMDYAVANGLVGDVVDINIETEAMKMD